MRHLLVLAAVALMAGPAIAQTQSPGPATQEQRHQASQAFGNAGDNLGDAARDTWHGLKHGWQATKQGAESGWNNATQDNNEDDTRR